MAIDDIAMDDYRDTLVSNDPYLGLYRLEKTGVIQNFRFRQRLTRGLPEKYITVSLPGQVSFSFEATDILVRDAPLSFGIPEGAALPIN